MTAGFRHRVRIESPMETRNSSGDVVPDWELVWDNVPVNIRAATGKEIEAAGQVHSMVNTAIEMRWLPGIEPTHRVINTFDGGRVYNVRAVLPDETQRQGLRLICDTGVSDG